MQVCKRCRLSLPGYLLRGGLCKRCRDVGEGEEEVLLPREDLAFRFLAYVLLLLGVCRLVSGLYWGCGYVALGLGTCLAEMGLLGYELLTHETVVLYRVMGVLCELVILSLVYIGSALPYCR